MKTPLCSAGTCIRTCPQAETRNSDQAIMTIARIAQGAHADSAERLKSRSWDVAEEEREFAPSPSIPGFHIWRNASRATIEIRELRISVAYGPQKFETRNCTPPKLKPATSAGGQLRRSPCLPATTNTRYMGRIRLRNGSCLPTIAESFSTSMPVTPAKATIGIPTAPKATGAV